MSPAGDATANGAAPPAVDHRTVDHRTVDHRTVDHRTLPRRRGSELENAILAAVLEELAEVGFGEFTIEGVARRARTGKVQVYRRWENRSELVLAALYHALPDAMDVPDTGSVREDLMLVLRRMTDSLANDSARVLISEVIRNHEFLKAGRDRFVDVRHRAVEQVLHHGEQRGEVHPDAITSQLVKTGPALVMHDFFVNGAPMADDALTEIVDRILVPLACAVPPR